MAGNRNSGRRPIPTQLKLLRGNPGKRRLNPEAEPQPAAVSESFDEPPAELKGNARAIAEWRRVAPLLRLCGLVTQAERSALTSLCFEWSTYLDAQRKLRRSRLVKDKNGVFQISPYVAIADRALSQCQRLWNELGLTPSGRAKLARLPPSPSSSSNAARTAPTSKWGGLI
jgi:P27 family predicted phage terminase small subunit